LVPEAWVKAMTVAMTARCTVQVMHATDEDVMTSCLWSQSPQDDDDDDDSFIFSVVHNTERWICI